MSTGINATIGLATCAAFADLDVDDRELIAPLADRGITAVPAVWDDPGIDWNRFDLTLIRNTWDYARRRDAFLAWAADVPGIANPADVVAWNTNKEYLRDLAAAGVPVVDTAWCAPGQRPTWPSTDHVVIKPAVGAGSVDAGRYDLDDAEQRRLATDHVDRLHRSGAVAMLQPYLDAVDEVGETALLFFGGQFSHAIGKAALLHGPDHGVDGLFREETITPRTPGESELAVAQAALQGIPGGAERLIYARVDIVPGPDGAPVLLELELAEPSLFLSYAAGAADRLADVITARLA